MTFNKPSVSKSEFAHRDVFVFFSGARSLDNLEKKKEKKKKRAFCFREALDLIFFRKTPWLGIGIGNLNFNLKINLSSESGKSDAEKFSIAPPRGERSARYARHNPTPGRVESFSE